MNESTKAVIFDFDGVIVDSVAQNWKHIRQVLSDGFGIELEEANISNYVGTTLRQQISRLIADYGKEINFNQFEEQLTLVKEQADPPEVSLGIEELVQSLDEAGFALGICTSSPRTRLNALLRHGNLLKSFSAIITSEDTKLPKPNSECFLLTANELGVTASNCVVIEDAPVGLVAAKAAGMKSIAIKSLYFDEDKLASADKVVESIIEIDPELIEGMYNE